MKTLFTLNLTVLVLQCFIWQSLSDVFETKLTIGADIWFSISQYLFEGVALISFLVSAWKCVSQRSLQRRGWVVTLFAAALAGGSVYAILLHYGALYAAQLH